MRFTKPIVLATAAASLLCAPLAAAVMVGQIDTFEDGTTQNWTVGDPVAHPAPPTNVAGGGPAGADDNYLLLTAFGTGGAGMHLSAFNLVQWAGDYLAAGVHSISMNVNNFGPDDLHLRLLFADPLMGPPANVAFSTTALFVPAGSGWTSLAFPIGIGDLTADLGTVVGALTNATELRIFHNPVPAFPGPFVGPAPVNAQLGVDDIRAVPEPSLSFLLSLGLLGVALRRSK